MCFVNMRYITYEELTRIIFILLYALKLRYITYEELTHENNKKMVAMVLRYITYEELTHYLNSDVSVSDAWDTLPMRNWHSLLQQKMPDYLQMRYITYEELTPVNKLSDFFFLLRYITYEELTLHLAFQESLIFLEIHYLWGIDTC